jgi:hypothetical protein
MNYMRSFVSTGGGTAAGTALAPAAEDRHPVTSPRASAVQPSEAPRTSGGYGLPCAKCRKYYPAHLSACPVCKSAERVSPIGRIPSQPAPAPAAPVAKGIDEERERVLREFKAQVYASHTQIGSGSPTPCAHASLHGKHDPATVCKSCYDRVQERVDVLEAALLMDLKEASQVIYDAVWADTSDSHKTYSNAAQALLNEVRRRAGMKLVITRAQSLPH